MSDWCKGKADPTAPHDMSLPGGRHKDGRCMECVRSIDRRRKARKKAERQRLSEKAVKIADDLDPSDLGRPAAPTTTLPDEMFAAQYHWQSEANRNAGEPDFMALLGALREPDYWPEADSDEMVPETPEDWSDLPKQPRVAPGTDPNPAATKRRSEARLARKKHRVALAQFANDRSNSLYNRRLAWYALTTSNEENDS